MGVLVDLIKQAEWIADDGPAPAGTRSFSIQMKENLRCRRHTTRPLLACGARPLRLHASAGGKFRRLLMNGSV
jgi:hypothetical protein